MELNKKIFKYFLGILLFFFLVSTAYKAYIIHEKRVIGVTEKRMIEGAKNCFFDSNCTGNRVTLKELVAKGYLKEEVNPQTKMYYNENSYIRIQDQNYEFVAV